MISVFLLDLGEPKNMTHDKKYWNKEMETLPPERVHKIQETFFLHSLFAIGKGGW
jgi:hypothetical protein